MNNCIQYIWNLFLIFPFKWSFPRSKEFHETDVSIQNFEDAHNSLSNCFEYSLKHLETGLSPQILHSLLTKPEFCENTTDLIVSQLGDGTKGVAKDSLQDSDLVLKGVPRRPFYKDLACRILVVTRWRHERLCSLDKESTNSYEKQRPLINAEVLGLTEIPPIHIPSLPTKVSPSTCASFLESIGEGVMELMGMRRTAGTELCCLPPDWNALKQAAQMPCKPNAKPPLLTVAARARAKHAHRSSKESIFGKVKGGTLEQNEAANEIIDVMIRDAVWINCHVFGGSGTPILEIRIREGYGARWSADWNIDPYQPIDVKFRGFLEPHMEDGFERRWRH